jgi:hypothetical protein
MELTLVEDKPRKEEEEPLAANETGAIGGINLAHPVKTASGKTIA